MKRKAPKSAFKKGAPRPANAGRKKGSVNKATALTREFIQGFLDTNAHRVQELFDKVARSSPREALKLITELCEFALPKLARVETQVTMRKEMRDFTDDEIVALLIERNAQRAQSPEAREPAPGSAKH